MNCDETTGLLSDQLNGVLAAADQRRLDEHLAGCAACRAEAAAVTELWNDLGVEQIAVPHERLRARFHAALAAYEERARSSSIGHGARYSWVAGSALRLAASVGLIAIGIVIGRGLPVTRDDEIAQLRQDMRIVSIALLQHQSAAERLRGVDRLQQVPASAAVTDALLDVVRNDRNVNVRLAAVEALSGQLHLSGVGEALAEALTRESTPLMQVTLAEMLLRNDVTDSVGTVRRFIEGDEVETSVQEYLNAVIEETQQNRQGDQLL